MIALRSLGSVEDADEVAQESLARAFHAIEEGRLETPEKLGAFVTGIARHVIADAHRRRSRTIPPGHELAAAGHPADQLAALVADEQAHRVRFALSTLSPTDREVLRLSFYEGLAPAEIAERLAEPAPRVRKRKARALDRLRLAYLQLSREEGRTDS
jgi:RNA polymerase sigma-70 factor (ECF subfamily)